MQIKCVLILALIFSCLWSNGQGSGTGCTFTDGTNYAPVAWDNYIEINFTNVKIQKDLGADYLYFDVNLKRKGFWYDATGLSGRPAALKQTQAIGTLNLYFDFNKDVMGGGVYSPTKSDIEVVRSTSNDEVGAFADYIAFKGMISVLSPTLTIGDVTMVLEDVSVASYFPVPTDAPLYYATYRWKIKTGANGKTGIKLRLGLGSSTDYYTLAANAKDGYMGVCQTGESLDVTVGTESAPVIKDIAVAGSACASAAQTLTATVEGTYTGITWVLKKGGAVSSDGTITVKDKASASIQWAAAASGTYQVCGTPQSSVAGAVEFCKDITIGTVPTLEIAKNPDAQCAGTAMTLTAQQAGGGSLTGLLNTSSYKWTKDASATSIGSALTQSITLAEGASTYHFSATTTGGCPVSKDITLTGIAAPTVSAIMATAGGIALTGKKYYLGDNITFSVPSLPGCTYSWKINGTAVTSTTNTYLLESATASTYTVEVTVSNGTCSTTVSDTYTITTGCGMTIALQDHFNPGNAVKICANGVALIDAVATATCPGSSVLYFDWYKKQGDGSYQKIYTDNTGGGLVSTYAVSSAGTYQVWVNTARGTLKSSDIAVTVGGSIYAGDVVEAWDPVSIPSSGGVACLGANGGNVDKYYWKPENLFNGSAYKEQFPVTKAMYTPTTFTVYASHSGGCVSSDDSHVQLSDNALKVTIEVAGNTVCAGGLIRLTAKVDGSGNYDYTWAQNGFTQGSTKEAVLVLYADKDVIPDAGILLTQTLYVKDNVTNIVGTASVVVNLSKLDDPKLKFDLVGNALCEGTNLKVVKQQATSPNIANYYWYVRDEADKRVTMTTTTVPEFKMNTRGNYTVWVAAQTVIPSGLPTGCYSDTVNARAAVKVKGFDLAWAPQPVGTYVSGQVLTAGAQASNTITAGSDYTFEWLSPAGGKMTSATNKTNPNMFQLEGAELSQYTFKVKATNDGCPKELTETIHVNATDNGLKLVLASDDVKYCYGGSAIMSAKVNGGTPDYTITWYKVGSEAAPIAGPRTMSVNGGYGNDRLVITTPLTNGDKIVAKVTDASAKVRRDTVTVRVLGTQAPQISAGADQLIAKGTSTYLLGTVTSPGSNPVTSWTWSDAANIAADATTANPQTKVLNSETDFIAYATNADGCTSVPDDVKIKVTADAYNLAVDIKAPTLLCYNSKVPLSATVNPADRTISSWSWSTSMGTLSTPAVSTTDWTMNVSTNGQATVMVLVKDQAGVMAVDKAVVNVSNKVAPELVLSGYRVNGGTNILCSGDTELKVTEKNSALLSGYVWYAGDDVVARDVATYKHTVTTAILVKIRVTANAASGGCPASNVAEVSLSAFPQPIIAFNEAESTPAFVGANAEVKMKAEVMTTTKAPYTFTWTHVSTPVNPNKPNYTDVTAATGTPPAATSQAVLTNGATPDSHPYDFHVYATDGNGCPSNKLDRTIVVDDGSLYVVVTPKYGDYCVGGAAILVADVRGADVTDNNVSYQWYKNVDIPIAGATGKELLITDPNNTDDYYVKVSCLGNDGQSVNTKLKAGSNTAPTLTGIDLLIPTGSRTALVVNTGGATIKEWQWSPENKLAAGESKLPSPYTVNLSAAQQYTVYGVDANNCISVPATVDVDVIGVTPPSDPQEMLLVKAWPTPDTVCAGNRLGINTTVWSTVSDVTDYQWIGDDNLSSKSTSDVVFNPTKKPLAAGTYSYTVVVTTQTGLKAADRANVVVTTGTTPTLSEPTVGDRCAGNEVTVQLSPSTNAQYTWILDGVVDNTVKGNKYTWPNVMDEAGKKFNLKVIAKTVGYCRTDTLTIDATVQPGVELKGLQALDSCGRVLVFAKNAEKNANYTWTLGTNTFLQTKAGGSPDTCYIVQKTPSFTTPSMAYSLKVEVTPNGGGCKSTGTYNGKLFFKPTAVISNWTPTGESTALPYTMIENKSGVMETVYLDAVNSVYTTNNSNVNWTARHATLTPASDKKTATLKNVSVDDSVVLAITNKENVSCASRDTMPVYLYPEAPALKIDTVDGSVVKVGLHLSGGNGDNYTIWSRKWDPYCLTSRFTGDQKYKQEAANITAKLWRETAMDTLEYYYATSGRTIAGRTWNSVGTSDTVGYYLFDLNIHTTLPSSYNYMAVYFDFAAMGCPTVLEMCRRINVYNAQQMIQVYNFDYATQSTKINTYMGSTDKVVGTAMTIDMATLRIVPKAKSKFLQYGKLPKTSFTLLRANAISLGNMNWIYALPQKSHVLEIDNLFSVDFTNVMQMYRWSFEDQTTSLTTKLTPTANPTGNKTALKPLQVIGLNLRNTIPSLDWK